MTEKASADDFEVQDFLKKKKKKKKRKHKEYDKNQENEEGESTQNSELDCAPPLLLEDQAAQSGEGFKKKKKKKRMREEQQSLLDSSCVELEHEFSNETAEEAPRKKKKKKKHKHNDSVDDQSVVTCDTVDQYTTDNCQKIDADYVYLEESVKKKKKKKLREKNEVQELPISQTETHDENEGERSEKKRKKKKKKKRGSSIQDVQEDTGDQLLLSSPEPNRQREDTALPLPTEEGDVTPPQELHKDDDCDASACENSVDVPANFSSPTKPANQSQNAPRARKAVKSRALILEESSSESDVETPEPSGSNRKDKNSSFTEASDAPNADEEDCLDSATCSATDLDTIKQELEEFIPHVRDISDSSIRKIAGRDLVRFREFKKQGIAVKFGRFSQKENNQIRKNIEAFLATTGIDSAEKLLFTSRYPEDKGTISRLKAEHLFCEKISEGIPRPWRLIYYRARKMFDPNNYKGRYSVEEKEKLKKYHALHGNDWKKISEMMSRSNLSVAMKYSEIKSDVNYGPWSKEETQKLMHAVEEVIRKRMKMEDANSLPSSDKSDRDVLIDCEKLSQKLPWTEIEAKVGTRYWRQCKQKWTTILMNKMTKGQQLYNGTKQLWSRIDLIKRLYEMKVEDANEVNWEELSDTVGPVPGAYIRAKFYKLKVSCVPFWQKKSFSEIVDYLYEKKLPELEKQLEKRKGSRVRSDNSAASQAKKALRFCDIFDCSEDSD